MAGIWTQLSDFQGILGVLIGLGATPTVDALKTRRRERRALDVKTAEQVMETLTALRRLEQMPGEDAERRSRRGSTREEPEENVEPQLEAWERVRAELVAEFHLASGRFSAKKLRHRLSLAHAVLERWDDLWNTTNVAESRSRRVACDFSADCMNAVLRRGKVPKVAKEIHPLMDDIELADDLREENRRSQLAWRRQQREERQRRLGAGARDDEHPADD